MLEFEELYKKIENENFSKFKEIEVLAQKESKRNNIISLIVCLILDFLILFKIFGMEQGFFGSGFGTMGGMIILVTLFQVLVVDVVVFVIISAIFSKQKRKYSEIFKNNIIKTLIDNFYDNISYSPRTQMPREIYREDRYNEYYNRYNSEDYFTGQILNKYDVQMAEVKTQKVETHRSNGRTHTTTTTIFHGLFAKVRMDKSLQTSLQIRKNYKTTEDKVRMDSQVFEEYFDVASDNKIITMQVLTHDVMEMLMSFMEETKIKFDVSIYGSEMYFRFYTGEVFELPSLKVGAFDKETLKKYYNILEFTYILSRKMIELIEEVKI